MTICAKGQLHRPSRSFMSGPTAHRRPVCHSAYRAFTRLRIFVPFRHRCQCKKKRERRTAGPRRSTTGTPPMISTVSTCESIVAGTFQRVCENTLMCPHARPSFTESMAPRVLMRPLQDFLSLSVAQKVIMRWVFVFNRRDQQQPVHLFMTEKTVEKIKKHMIWFFDTTMKQKSRIVKIGIKSCAKEMFFTGLRFENFTCCFRSVAFLADGHVGGCTKKQRGNRVGMKETVIKM